LGKGGDGGKTNYERRRVLSHKLLQTHTPKEKKKKASTPKKEKRRGWKEERNCTMREWGSREHDE